MGPKVVVPGSWVRIPLGAADVPSTEVVPAVVLAARAPGVVLAVFPPSAPCTAAVVDLDPADAITYVRTLDGEIRSGGWPVIVVDRSFDITSWPVADFEAEVSGSLVLTPVVDDAMGTGRQRRGLPDPAGARPGNSTYPEDVVGLHLLGILNTVGRHVLRTDPPAAMVHRDVAPVVPTGCVQVVIPQQVEPERLWAIEDLLEPLLVALPGVEVDGHAIGEDDSIIFVYGLDGDALAERLREIVSSGAFPPGTVVEGPA